MNRTLAIVLALLPQVLLLGWTIAREELALRDGIPVVLEVRGYDPVDALSGRYIRVPPAIRTLAADDVSIVADRIEAGATVWVGLVRAEPFWRPLELRVEEPPPNDDRDRVWIRGRLEKEWQRPQAGRYRGSLTVDYGFDRFYIPEAARDPTWATGADGRRAQLSLLVRVRASGEAAIEDLRVDGEPYADWNRRQPR
jgi:uncharacterized membrane-anchored protein